MTISASEIVLRDSANSLGGIMSGRRISAGKDGFVKSVSNTSRLAGFENWYKAFLHVAADAGPGPLGNVLLFLAAVTPLDTRIKLISGTQRDVFADLTGAERIHGVGLLAADILSTDTTLDVVCESGSAADTVFQAGDLIRISDGTNTDFLIVDTVAWASEVVTITTTDVIGHDYASATPAVVSSCIQPGDIEPSYGTPVIVGDVTYDDTGFPFVLDYISTLEETIIITFVDTINFTAVSDTQGSLPAGSTTADYVLANDAYGRDRLTILADGWTTAATAGDTVTIELHPAAVPFWLGLVGAAAIAAGEDSSLIGWYGEAP